MDDRRGSKSTEKPNDEFKRGRSFECHETLEELWRAEPRAIRYQYQGILQIGVALYHLQAGRYRATATLLERASQYLQPFTPRCMGIDVDRLVDDAARCLTHVKRLGDGGLGAFDWSVAPEIEIRDWKLETENEKRQR
jgi:predicted metal-dependent hydrolase